MKITIEITPEDLAQLGVDETELEMAVKAAVEGGLDVDGDTLYLNDTTVLVHQVPANEIAG